MIDRLDFNRLKPGTILNDIDGKLWKLVEVTTILDGYEDRYGNEYAETKRIVRVEPLNDIGHTHRYNVNLACKRFSVMELG